MSAIIIQSEVAHYEVLGRGRPVLFLHGWVGSWRYWIPAMQAVSIAYRAYALDLWGFGDSAKDARRYLILDQVSLLEEFLTQMGIGKIALVGHGLGAVVGMMFAARHPAQVERLLAIGLPVGTNAVQSRFLTDTPVELADWLLGKTEVAETVRVEANKTDVKAVQTSLNGIDAHSLVSTATEMTTPCLLVHGMNDLAVSFTNPDLARLENQENFHSIFFEGSGHFPMLEEPNKFNRLMNDFLSLKTGESPRQLQLKDEWKRRVR